MPRRVQGPDGTIHEFPDDVTDAEISSALEAIPSANAASAPKARTWTDTAVDFLPTAGGMVGGVAGALAGGGTTFGVGALPAGIAGATVGGGMGEAAKLAINRLRGKQSPSTLTEAAKDVALEGAIQGGSEALGGAAGAIMRPVGAALMQSAVKPGLRATARAIGRGVAQEDLPVVKTLLKEGVTVSEGGLAKLNRILTSTNEEIDKAVKGAAGYIYPEKVAQRVEPVVEKAWEQVNPVADVRAASGAAEEFMATRGGNIRPARPMSVQEAQKLKVGTYKALGEKKYGELSTPAIEAQKALARGLKEDIETEVAKQGIDISALNVKEAGAIQAKEAIARRLAAAGNRDPVALAWLAHNPVTGLAFIMERSPAVKSLISRGLYNSAGTAARINPQVIRLAVHAVASAPDEGSQ